MGVWNFLHFQWDKGQNLKGQRTNDKVFFAYSKLNSTFLIKIFFQGSIIIGIGIGIGISPGLGR